MLCQDPVEEAAEEAAEEASAEAEAEASEEADRAAAASEVREDPEAGDTDRRRDAASDFGDRDTATEAAVSEVFWECLCSRSL